MTVGLVLGGARSGKSRFAERQVEASGRAKLYIATSEIWDDEMARRVDLHRQQRGDGWHLVEEPLALCEALEDCATADRSILVDCLTLWLTNLMMAERDVSASSKELVSTLVALPRNAHVVLVSNEVGQGIVPMEKMSRDFRDHAGRLHQDIAAAVDDVWFVTAGLAQKLK
ncbi:MAG: bifunctional adenosylcobinamide kinase/adenosylcobinamide-phosphate guanylyltransferase [Pseudomonadota bacterium]